MVNQLLNRAKVAQPPRVISVRALTREDLAKLKQVDRVQPRVKSFRDTHHRLARLCAAGLRKEEILRITGYSSTRLHVLRSDPAFQNLIAEYRGKVTEAFADEFKEQAEELMRRGMHHMHEHFDRADEAGELVPLGTLVKITGDLADRFGYSKKSTVQNNHTIDFGKRLERAMSVRGQATVIDAKVLSSPPPLASSPQGLLTPALEGSASRGGQ